MKSDVILAVEEAMTAKFEIIYKWHKLVLKI